MIEKMKLDKTLIDLNTSFAGGSLNGYSAQHYGADIHGVTKETLVDAIGMLSTLVEMEQELRRARDELCRMCGDYKEAHNGACNDCHWKDEWREMTFDER